MRTNRRGYQPAPVVTNSRPADEGSLRRARGKETNAYLIAERSAACAVADAEPLPSGVSPRRLRRGLLGLAQSPDSGVAGSPGRGAG